METKEGNKEGRKGKRGAEEENKEKKICLTLHNLCFLALLGNKITPPNPHRICYHYMALCEVPRNTLWKILHHINIIFSHLF